MKILIYFLWPKFCSGVSTQSYVFEKEYPNFMSSLLPSSSAHVEIESHCCMHILISCKQLYNYLLSGNKVHLYFTEMNSRYFIFRRFTRKIIVWEFIEVKYRVATLFWYWKRKTFEEFGGYFFKFLEDFWGKIALKLRTLEDFQQIRNACILETTLWSYKYFLKLFSTNLFWSLMIMIHEWNMRTSEDFLPKKKQFPEDFGGVWRTLFKKENFWGIWRCGNPVNKGTFSQLIPNFIFFPLHY